MANHVAKSSGGAAESRWLPGACLLPGGGHWPAQGTLSSPASSCPEAMPKGEAPMTAWWLLLVLAPAADDTASFSQVKIEEPYRKYLVARPVLMEAAGAKVIRLKNGRRMIVGVGMIALEDSKAKTLVDAHRVAELKALVSVEKQRKGVQVATEESVKDRTVLKLENGKETGKSVSEILSVTTARLKAVMGKGMSRVGTWRSKDGKTFYLAMGMIVDAGGKLVEE